MPVADQNLISSELKRLSYSEPLTGVYDELAERVKRSWQDRGFFHAQVNGDAIVTTRGADRGLAFSAQINEGTQYNLGGISFRGNKALTNVKFLRSVFPIEDGDVFNRSTVATGLENLRKGYGQYGHINYTGVPETRVDDEKHRIYVVVDIDEGKQFYVDRVEVLGLGDFSRQELVRESALQSGSVYNARLDEIFLMTIKSHFPDCECSDVKHNQIDERRGTVVLTYDLGSCAAGR
jgi:outer membrane protein insertion porin family